ncbi:hypothetical protein NUU61_004462, partial [Penicillium alfredii]
EATRLLQKCRRPFPSDSAASPSLPPSSSVPRAPNASTLRGVPPLEGMTNWLLMLGHKTDDIDRLNVIHVAGTKGKGSTCAYVDCFLQEHARRNEITRKVGLYTSPSLWPRNRIRIDSTPLPEDLFTKYVIEVSRCLSIESDMSPSSTKNPGFLQMMAIVSFHTFIKEGVDVVICEAHHGGEFDATNFIRHPAITAITKIGMDHVDNLGGTIQSIAWHKSGIFKAGVLALSVPQDPDAEHEIERRSKEKGALLQFAEVVKMEGIPLEQRENVALATQIAHEFLQRSDHSLDERDVLAGIEKCRWPGRFDIIDYSGCTWYLDGAHNETSMEVVANWYERVASNSIRVLVFAHFSPKRTRDWSKILQTLGTSLQSRIQHVIFVDKIEYDHHFTTPSGWLEEYAQFWMKRWPPDTIDKAPTVKKGIEKAMKFGTGAQILVTGSLYLVEAALEIVKT